VTAGEESRNTHVEYDDALRAGAASRQFRHSVPMNTFQASSVIASLISRLDQARSPYAAKLSWSAFTPIWCERLCDGCSAVVPAPIRRSDSVTDALMSLRRLRVPERVQFKIALLSWWLQRRFYWDSTAVRLTDR